MKTRCDVQASLLTFSLIFGLFGCGKPTQKLDVPPLQAPAAKVIRVYTWADYFDLDVFAAFEAETGVTVDYVTFSSTDEMEAKLKSEPGECDVIVADDSIMDQMWELKLIRKLDHSKIPNIANIAEPYRNLAFDVGNKFTAPYTWGTTLVAYRKDKIANPEKSWSLLWNEAYKGKVMMIGERFEILAIPLMILGQSVNSSDPSQLEAATNMLIEQIDKVDLRLGDDADVKAGLDDGSIWAAMCYSGDAAVVAEDNENVAFFIPKEGGPRWVDSFAIVRETKIPDVAHQFVNFMLDGKNAAAHCNHTWYASPNAAAQPFMNKELLEDPSVYPAPEILAKCETFEKLDAKREELLNNAWLKVHRRLRDKQIAGTAEEGE